MATLLQVLAIYFFLSLVVVSAVWALIAREGFMGLQQTNSPLAKFFRTRFTVVKGSGPESNVSVVLTAPLLATSVLLVTVVISFGGTPRVRENHRFVPCYDNSPIMQASTSMPELQVINADLH